MSAAAEHLAPETDTADEAAVMALACDEILGGQPGAAQTRLKALIAEADFNPIHHYWLAAAQGALGDGDAFAATLAEAQAGHALGLMQSVGADLDRLRADPAYAAHLAGAFYENGHVAVASAAYAYATASAQTALPTLIGHGLSLQHQGRSEDAAAAFARACQLHPNSPQARSFLLYSLFYVENGVERHAAEARRWAKAYADLAPPAPQTYFNAPLDGRPLSIGYVAPSIMGLQVRQFLAPVLEHHDPAQVHVTLYLQDEQSGEGVPCDQIRGIGHLSDQAAAKRVQDDKIDVLIDLWGHTAGGRLGLFAHRAAPVQVSWLNYVQTTGLKAIDYLIHVDCMDAPGAQDQCAETIWRLGPVMAPFRPDPRPEPVPTPALANGFVTFGSYNHPSRLNDAVVSAWSRILKRVGGAVLMLRYKYYVDEVLQNTTLMRFAAHGVDPGRIIFAPSVVQPAYYQSYAEIDVALDPSPCPGGTTSCDAVANGVPLLTLAGDDYFSRIGVAVVEPLGLDELVTHSWDEYVDRAVAMASDIPALDALRARVRVAFDASGRRDEAGFTRRWEGALREMFSLWDDGRSRPATRT